MEELERNMSERSGNPRAYIQVLLMFAIIIATIALGFFMMPSSQQEHDQLLQQLGTTNHGTLLVPLKPVQELALTDPGGNPWQWDDYKPKWRLLLLSDNRCDGECGELLYTTRQVHIRLGKNSHRFERLLLATRGELDAGLEATIEETHPYLKVIQGDAAQISAWLADTSSPWQPGEGKAIVVDPAGMAMMTYDTGHDGNGILEDLNHLLKYSAD